MAPSRTTPLDVVKQGVFGVELEAVGGCLVQVHINLVGLGLLHGKSFSRGLVHHAELLVGQGFYDAVIDLLSELLVLEDLVFGLVAEGHQDAGLPPTAFLRRMVRGINVSFDQLVVNRGSDGDVNAISGLFSLMIL